jgi:putrescine transport system substrate-binding protein
VGGRQLICILKPDLQIQKTVRNFVKISDDKQEERMKLRNRLKELSLAAVSMVLITAPALAKEQLFIYNWSDYFAEDTLSAFNKRTGIETRLDYFDSLEVLETRLLTGGSGFDVVFPSTTVGQRLIAAGALQPLDKSKLTNYGNLDPTLLKLIANQDPDNRYLVPYMSVTTGIAYNPNLISARMPDAPTDSLAMLFDPALAAKFADCGIGVVDAPNEVIPIALNYLGLNPYSSDAADLEKAEKLLMAMRPYVRHMQSGQFISDMASGQLCLTLMWSGDASISTARAEEDGGGHKVNFTIPKEGTIVSFDSMAIPADAANVEQAHKFINYILEPQVVADITNAVFTANPNAAATALVDPGIANNPNVYPPDEVRSKLFVDKSMPARENRERIRIWTAFRAGE